MKSYLSSHTTSVSESNSPSRYLDWAPLDLKFSSTCGLCRRSLSAGAVALARKAPGASNWTFRCCPSCSEYTDILVRKMKAERARARGEAANKSDEESDSDDSFIVVGDEDDDIGPEDFDCSDGELNEKSHKIKKSTKVISMFTSNNNLSDLLPLFLFAKRNF